METVTTVTGDTATVEVTVGTGARSATMVAERNRKCLFEHAEARVRMADIKELSFYLQCSLRERGW